MHGNHLTPLRIKKLTEPGRYADGNCLYLVVSDRGSKRWILRFVVKGRRRDMGLGSASLINLDEARDLARKYRKMAKLGIDPLIERRKTQAAFLTLKEAAIKVHALNLPSWKNKKHSEQWITSLQRHVFPKIGTVPISDVTSSDIYKVLSPIWVDRNDTAKKIRQRLRMIIRWARAQGFFQGDDPVELAEQALPKVKSSGLHFKSVQHQALPAIIKSLQSNNAISLATRLALEFLILTAGRTSEVLEATWEEIDFNEDLWVIPADRMKANKPHHVPLTVRMKDILENAKTLQKENNLIFPSSFNGLAMSNNTLRLALQNRLGVNATVHGMRAAFKDWASETTNYANEVSEMALGHQIPNKVEAAYRRGTLLSKRRDMMNDWSLFISGAKNGLYSEDPAKDNAHE